MKEKIKNIVFAIIIAIFVILAVFVFVSIGIYIANNINKHVGAAFLLMPALTVITIIAYSCLNDN